MSVPIADASSEPIRSPRVLMRRVLPKQWGEFESGLDGESMVAIRKISDPRDEPIQILLDWQVLAGR